MRRQVLWNEAWSFTKDTSLPEVNWEQVTLPHSWNALDGQGGGRYYRGTCWYRKRFRRPEYHQNEEIWLEFQGISLSSTVFLNGTQLSTHECGFSTFRIELTPYLQEENELLVAVDNSVSDRIYPQTADFTFFGGIYRDVLLITAPKIHFALGYHGSQGIRVTPVLAEDLQSAQVHVEAWLEGGDSNVTFAIGAICTTVPSCCGKAEAELTIPNVRLWNGKIDPYLYMLDGSLETGDAVSVRFGCRTFRVDPDRGFFLNGKPYHLHGVAKHQDRLNCGNAVPKELLDEDMSVILEIGATTVRLAHYQHPQYFYDLCDENGLIVWAEIPYITNHLTNGRENTLAQMHDLVVQNYHHPSIVCWGLSNEITVVGEVTEEKVENHRLLNDLAHKLDSTRLTVMAHENRCPFNSPLQYIPDIASYNLYFGWYTGELADNADFLDRYHAMHPNRCIGLSEYGADANILLQSSHPVCGDCTESYQAVYHEHLVDILEARPYIWASHVWNLFEFAAAGRDGAGIPGRNVKGLVTYDRKQRKDAFYLYQAHWTQKPMLHICGSRYVDRTEDVTEIKVYSNQHHVTLLVDGKEFARQEGRFVFRFQVPISGSHSVEAVSGSLRETITIRKVDTPNPAYCLPEKESVVNWFDSDSCKSEFYSLADNLKVLLDDPRTEEIIREVIMALDPALLEIPGLMSFLGNISVQQFAERNGKPEHEALLKACQEKLQTIIKL